MVKLVVGVLSKAHQWHQEPNTIFQTSLFDAREPLPILTCTGYFLISVFLVIEFLDMNSTIDQSETDNSAHLKHLSNKSIY